ncbi:MAG: molybdate ABC transporter substrate-binding protein [Kangiellaceae bacterium]|nr:molybdate ABC transporter substrate-binding protein [Kangiellaceae bacterium]
MQGTRLFLIVLMSNFICCLPILAEPLKIAVASNFLQPAKVLAAKFESVSGHKTLMSSGSSGKLFVQITRGAPFDIFLSADSEKPASLLKSGLAKKGSLQTYAMGRLSVWFKRCEYPIELANLNDASINKVAIANPKLAPYGKASKQLLQKYGLWRQISTKLVFPENISQVSQLASMRVVDAAIIATSQRSALLENFAESDPKSCLVELNPGDYSPIKQQLVIIKNSQQQVIAEEFSQFLRTKNTQSLIKKMGYSLP